MVELLNKIFETIDNLDADENIKNFYKELLLFEYNEDSIQYKTRYEKLINFFTEEI